MLLMEDTHLNYIQTVATFLLVISQIIIADSMEYVGDLNSTVRLRQATL